MIQRSDLKTIQGIVEKFFEKSTLEVSIEVSSTDESTVFVKARAAEPQILIGEGGQTLVEIQHILKLIIKRKLGIQDKFYLDLDINEYKKKKLDYLKEMARSVADEVSLMKKEKELPAMTAAERRTIHMELANREDVSAESIGEEPNRRLVLRPK